MSDFRVSMVAQGVCNCGRPITWIQANTYPEDVYQALAKNFEIITLDESESTPRCSACGQLISRPPAEVLDPERFSLGRWLLDIAEELDSKAGSQSGNIAPGDVPF